MCEPVSATTMMYLSIASAAVGVYAQQQTAKAQTKAIRSPQENEREEAHESAEEQLGQRIREQREARARARVAAGESGAVGIFFDAAILSIPMTPTGRTIKGRHLEMFLNIKT